MGHIDRDVRLCFVEHTSYWVAVFIGDTTRIIQKPYQPNQNQKPMPKCCFKLVLNLKQKGFCNVIDQHLPREEL